MLNSYFPRIITLGCLTSSMLEAKANAVTAINNGDYAKARKYVDEAEALNGKVNDLTLAIYGTITVLG